jgi:tetratricopeptide (TPR) repeat protein
MADQAIALRADDVNAHLQKLFVAVSLANAADARAQVPFIKLGDEALEAAIEGRVLLLEDKAPEALAVLLKAIEKDPRRVDATILAGAAAVKAHNEPKGWELVLSKTLKADPLQSGPRRAMAPHFTRANDLIAPARGVFAKLGKEKDDPNPYYAEGAMAWHAGELGPADAAFSEVIAADPTNSMALAYRALIAIKRRDYANAMKHATKAVGADHSLGLALYALGSAQFLTGKVEQARATLRDATERAPWLLCAKARLAEADIKVKKLPAAKTALVTILSVDPTYTEAKRVLYGMSQ